MVRPAAPATLALLVSLVEVVKLAPVVSFAGGRGQLAWLRWSIWLAAAVSWLAVCTKSGALWKECCFGCWQSSWSLPA